MEISSRAKHKYIDISRLPPYIQQLAKKYTNNMAVN